MTEECGNITYVDGMKRTCKKPKGHSGKHHDNPWAEGLTADVIYG